MTQGLVRQHFNAKLAWGVNLHDESGQVHESLDGIDLVEPFEDQPALDAVVGVEPTGWACDGDLLIIKRTLTYGHWRMEEIPAATVTTPTEAETAAVNQALDYLGYTGPRQIRLLLALDYM